MGRGRIATLFIAVAIIALALMRTATASHLADHKAFSGGSDFRGLVVKTHPGVTVASVDPNWQTIDSRGFQIPAGESQLIVADFFAESFCSGTGICQVQILVGRTLGTALPAVPNLTPVFDLASSDGTESHAISRALCVRNATASPLNVSVWVQARKNSANVSSFDLFNYAFKIARNSSCTPTVNI